MKKRILKFALLVAAVLVAGYFAPGVYWRISGELRRDAFYGGRPTIYWRAKMIDDDHRAEIRARNPFGSGPATLRQKIESWFDDFFGEKARQTEKLGEDADALPVLRELLRDEDKSICNRAFQFFLAQGIAAHGDLPELVEFLMNDRLSPTRHIRTAEAGMRTLDWIHGTTELLDPCKKWLAHEDPKRVSLAAVPFAWRRRHGVPQLVERLDQIDAGRDCVIDILADLGGNAEEALPKLREIARADQSPETRVKAANAIARITSAN